MASIAASLERIKGNPLGLLDVQLVNRVCRECKHSWRERELDPATTVALFVQQVVNGNAPCSEVRQIAAGRGTSHSGPRFSPQAYCDARTRLPLTVLHGLFHEVYQGAVPLTRKQEHLWHGHRTFHIDGSTFSMPDTPQLRQAFGMPSGQAPGCGFPVAHLLVLFSAATGLLIDIWASPLRTGDLAETPEAHLHLDAGDILIGDDTFSGYPAQDLLDLRLRRWDVETCIGHLKTTMKMDVLHCKTEQGVRKELAVFGIVYNLVRAVMLEASHRQSVPVSRISFVDAYKWMRHARPSDRLTALLVNPLRPNRIEPRCKKRRAKQYDLMNKPRAYLRKLLKKQRKNA